MFVTTTNTGVGALFSDWCAFVNKQRERHCCSEQSLSREYKFKFLIFLWNHNIQCIIIHQPKCELFHVEIKLSRQVPSGPLDRNHTTYNFEIIKISHSNAVQKFWYWHLTCPSDQVYWINRHRQMILKKYPILHTQVSNLGQKYLKIHFWPKYFTLEYNILNQNRTADFLCVLKFLVISGTHGTVTVVQPSHGLFSLRS